MTDYSYIDRNVETVRKRIEQAARSVGRDPGEITLLAAVKYAEPGEIVHLQRCGITTVGENRVQQFVEHSQIEEYRNFSVHFIGTLQTNKVKYIVGKVGLIESVDSLKLVEEIDKQSKKQGVVTDMLCEINSGREENKSGVMPEDAEAFCADIERFSHVKLKGFMTMAPNCEKIDEYRKYFGETYRTALDIWQKKLHNISNPIISMGMSGSFEQAILEGATLVRVGRILFEKNKI